jgi:hypothetical protein
MLAHIQYIRKQHYVRDNVLVPPQAADERDHVCPRRARCQRQRALGGVAVRQVGNHDEVTPNRALLRGAIATPTHTYTYT